MKVWFFNLEKRFEDEPEVLPLGAGVCSGHIFPNSVSGPNKEICPSTLFFSIAHLPNHTDLLGEKAGARSG